MFFHFHPATSHQGTNILNIDFFFFLFLPLLFNILYIWFFGRRRRFLLWFRIWEKKKKHTSASKTFEGGFALRVPLLYGLYILLNVTPYPPSKQLNKDVSSLFLLYQSTGPFTPDFIFACGLTSLKWNRQEFNKHHKYSHGLPFKYNKTFTKIFI